MNNDISDYTAVDITTTLNGYTLISVFWKVIGSRYIFARFDWSLKMTANYVTINNFFSDDDIIPGAVFSIPFTGIYDNAPSTYGLIRLLDTNAMYIYVEDYSNILEVYTCMIYITSDESLV